MNPPTIYRVSASGGTATPISKLDTNRGELSHRWPMFLPDGKHYLYMAANFAAQKGVDAIFVGSLESNEKRFVTEADANAAYAVPGYLLFYRDRARRRAPHRSFRRALSRLLPLPAALRLSSRCTMTIWPRFAGFWSFCRRFPKRLSRQQPLRVSGKVSCVAWNGRTTRGIHGGFSRRTPGVVISLKRSVNCIDYACI